MNGRDGAREASLSRRALLSAGAVAPLLLAMATPSPAAAALETWAQWTARMQRMQASRSPVRDPQHTRTGECTHLWRDYVVYSLGAPWGAGQTGSYAHHLWTQFDSDAEAKAAFTRVGVGSAGRRGDGVVWSSSFFPPAGHVAVLVDDLGDSVRVWGQNHDGNRFPELRTYAKRSIHGYLRPRSGGPVTPTPAPTPTPTTLGDEMYLARDTSTGVTFLFTPNGRIALKSAAHARLFERLFADRAQGRTSAFTSGELHSMSWYVRNVGV